MIEQEVYKEILITNTQIYLSPNKGKSSSKFNEKFLNMTNKTTFKFFLIKLFSKSNKVEIIWIFQNLLSKIWLSRRERVFLKLVRAFPCLLWTSLSIQWSRTFRLHTFSMVFCAYHNLSSFRSSFCSNKMLCPHGIWPTTCWLIVNSGYSFANWTMYLIFVRENPFMSGKVDLRSFTNFSIIFAPQSVFFCSLRIDEPISQ